MALTKEGARALGLEVDESYRRGGPEHRYWVQRIAEHLQRCGYDVKKEVPAGGAKRIDIVAKRNGRSIAFEIETGNSDVRANRKKCLTCGVDRIVFVTTSAEADTMVRRQLADTAGVDIIRAVTAIRRKW